MDNALLCVGSDDRVGGGGLDKPAAETLRGGMGMAIFEKGDFLREERWAGLTNPLRGHFAGDVIRAFYEDILSEYFVAGGID